MYPLSVLLKSPVVERKVAAESLMTSLNSLEQEFDVVFIHELPRSPDFLVVTTER